MPLPRCRGPPGVVMARTRAVLTAQDMHAVVAWGDGVLAILWTLSEDQRHLCAGHDDDPWAAARVSLILRKHCSQ